MRYGSLLGVLARQTAVIVPVPQASRIWIDMGSLPQNRCDGYIAIKSKHGEENNDVLVIHGIWGQMLTYN